jgi:hypothetical protein
LLGSLSGRGWRGIGGGALGEGRGKKKVGVKGDKNNNDGENEE